MNVFIAGVGMTPLGKHPNHSVKQLTGMSVAAALQDAGLSTQDIQAAWFSNTRQGIFEGQHGLRGQCALRANGFGGIPVFNTDAACASSSLGLNLAVAYLKAGMADIALVVGTEKMHYPGKKLLMFEAFWGSVDQDLGREQLQRAIALSSSATPFAAEVAGSTGEHSVFMEFYAAMARHHMAKFGLTQRQLAMVASKNHWNSQWNPLAQYRTPMTVEEVLADRQIVWPLTRSMCAPMSDGSGAVVLCSERALKRMDRDRCVRILATQCAMGMAHEVDDFENHLVHRVARSAYEEAGIGPQDIDVIELHDASAFGEIKHLESLGICPQGEGGALTESGATRLDGRIPVNPSGGLLSKGHPIAATGCIQMFELVTQLRGEAHERQVVGARLALAENGGGFYDGEEAVAAVTILERTQ